MKKLTIAVTILSFLSAPAIANDDSCKEALYSLRKAVIKTHLKNHVQGLLQMNASIPKDVKEKAKQQDAIVAAADAKHSELDKLKKDEDIIVREKQSGWQKALIENSKRQEILDGELQNMAPGVDAAKKTLAKIIESIEVPNFVRGYYMGEILVAKTAIVDTRSRSSSIEFSLSIRVPDGDKMDVFADAGGGEYGFARALARSLSQFCKFSLTKDEEKSFDTITSADLN